MTTRRSFLKMTAWSAAALAAGCNPKSSKKEDNLPDPEISLAQWSLNRAFFANELDVNDFAKIASDSYGIKAVEYVNQFYTDFSQDEQFWLNMKARADNAGVKSLLIMVDDEGDLGNTNDQERKKSVENHYKWIHAAKLLGCHSIRVNAFGAGNKTDVKTALVDGMGKLSEYSAQEGINVLIENHGLYSSDAKWIVDIIKEVDNPYFGTLPDFGNWCLNAKWGSTQQNKCSEVYDRYRGVAELLPFAKSVSAKSYNFNEEGEDTVIDYHRMLQIVKDSGYNGYIGIEYEGEELSEPAGIRTTKALIEKAWSNLS
jgi:L-ribulose-5-phosphate 3-epimerase